MPLAPEPGMMDLAENVNNPNFGNDRLLVQFYKRPVADPEATKLEGRPIFREEDYIRIRIPGDKGSMVDREVREEDTKRFGGAYRKWKESGEGESLSGTPLSTWPAVTRAQVEEMAYFGVKTVEQLANISDTNAQKFMGIATLRDKARAFILAAKEAAPLAAMTAALDDRDNKIQTLEGAIEEMRSQLAEFRRNKK